MSPERNSQQKPERARRETARPATGPVQASVARAWRAVVRNGLI